MTKYVGLDLSDIPALYRNRAQLMADGDVPRAVKVFVFEFDADGYGRMTSMGMTDDHDRELIQNAASCVSGLSELIAACNKSQAT